MTSAHFIYIPMILSVGFVLGFVIGGRAARDALAMADKRVAAPPPTREARKQAVAAAATAPAKKETP